MNDRMTDSTRAVRLRIGGIQLAVLGRSEASALFIVVVALAAVTLVGLRRGADGDAPNPSSRLAVMNDLTPASVSRLKQAWIAHTGEYAGGMGPNPPQSVEGFQTRPALVGGLLVVTTTTSKVIALDAETGTEAWRFDPFAGKGHVCDFPHRGVAVWSASTSEATVFSGTCDGHLLALDAKTGQPRAAFGSGGSVDLRSGLGVAAGQEYGVTSAPAIFRDLVIIGSRVPEGESRGPSGDVRAFDVHTGQERWRFHTVAQPGEPGHDTWAADAWQRRTGVNVWSTMAVDDERGLLFMPIGSASYDFYGADRPGPSLYANCLVALDAATGQLKWHFQLVHHDLWDYDPPAQPILADITSNGRRHSRSHSADEDGTHLRLRSRNGSARVRRGRARRAAERRSWRTHVGDAAVPDQAGAARPHDADHTRRSFHAGRDRAHRVRPALRSSCHERRDLHA